MRKIKIIISKSTNLTIKIILYSIIQFGLDWTGFEN